MNNIDSRAELTEAIRQRPVTDWQTDFWPAFLLGLITCGIYTIYVMYKLIERRMQHFERMIIFRYNLIRLLKDTAAAAGRTEELQGDIATLENMHLAASNRDRMGDKSPVLWTILGVFVTFLYVYYFLNDDFRAHEANEHAFMLKASELMQRLGMSEQQIVTAATIPERNFVTYLVLSLVTCGVYMLYWLYTIITDGNRHFDDHAAWENQVNMVLSR